jgi:hypothetical protein
MSVNDNRYRGRGGDRDLARLERDVERLADMVDRIAARVGKLERVMWVTTGLGSATVITAVYNLAQNLQQTHQMTGR